MTSGRNPRHQSDVSEYERVYRILRLYRNAIDTTATAMPRRYGGTTRRPAVASGGRSTGHNRCLAGSGDAPGGHDRRRSAEAGGSESHALPNDYHAERRPA